MKIRLYFRTLILIAILPINLLKAQTTVFTDDFNRGTTTYTTGQAYGTPAVTYNSGNGNNGALTYRLWSGTDYCLQIAGSGTAGTSFVYFDNSGFTYPYGASNGLHASSGLITWYFNFRNYGLTTSYKPAIVLAASNSDFALGNGYAVYYGKNTTGKFSLAKYTGGVIAGTVTDVIPEATALDLGGTTNQDYASVMVTYDPSTDNWSMYVRDDGVTAFNVPWTTLTTPVYTQHGSAVADNMYTTAIDNLKYSGYLYKYNTGTSSSYKASFDNYKVTQIATTAPTTQSSNFVFSPVALTTLTASWTNGNGGKRIVLMNNTNSFTDPTNGVEPTANAVYGGSSQQVVYNGTGNTVNITGLTASTQYWFKVYDYSYGAALYPFYQTATSINNLGSVTTLGSVVAPTVSNPTATSIINSGGGVNSVTLGGNITSDGGSSITDRGTLWKTTSGVTISDNLLSEGGITTGIFTSARTGLPSKTLIYYAAYATNSAGTALSSESSFYTKADLPTTTVGSFAANTVSDNTQLQLTWVPATGANGYLITQKAGAAAGGTAPSNAISYSVGTILGTGTVCAIVNSGSATSVNITGLAVGTQYTFRIYPFGYDGTNAQTYNYATSLTSDATGATLLGTGFNSPNTIPNAYVSNGKLVIYGGEVYNSIGVKVASVKSTQKTELSLQQGIYIVRSLNGNQKVLIP